MRKVEEDSREGFIAERFILVDLGRIHGVEDSLVLIVEVGNVLASLRVVLFVELGLGVEAGRC